MATKQELRLNFFVAPPMPICEYCGRLHQTQLPDYRFCSTNCRREQVQFFIESGYTPDGNPTLLDYRLTQADYLAEHSYTVAQRASLLIQEANEAEDEEAIMRKKDAFIEDLARGNSTVEKIYYLTKSALLIRGQKQE